jgi:Tol biopolymer transport system component
MRPVLAAAMVAIGVVVTGWWTIRSNAGETPLPRPLTQFSWTLPAGLLLDSVPVVSPDGEHVAFVARGSSGRRLFVRALGARDAVAVPGTEGSEQPFWSPDGRSLGFFAEGRLMKVEWPGGGPVPIAPAPQPRGGAWNSSGHILFAPDVILAGISRVAASGGRAEPATLPDRARGDTSHWWPTLLPDGNHFLFFVRSVDDQRIGVYLGRSDRPAASPAGPLFRSDSAAAYAPLHPSGGALLYVADGRIEARRFDTRTMTVGDARSLGLTAGATTLFHPGMMSAGADVLAFAEAPLPQGNRLEIVDRSGARLQFWDEAEAQNWPRLSPDGRHLARQRVHSLQNNPDIWVDDLQRGTRVRVTTAPDPDIQPVWSPDGRQLAYVSGHLPGRTGTRVVQIAAADGTGVVRTLPCPADYCEPTDWAPDGGMLIVNTVSPDGSDVWTIPTGDGARARPLLAEPFAERDARLSPDGRWLAYVSDETGRPEVSVRARSGPARRIVISGDGGAQPVWQRDGGALYFVDLQGHVRGAEVRWSADGVPDIAPPRRLPVPPVGFGHWGTQYDVSPDGQRFFLLRRNDDQPPRDIHIVIGWQALLDR